MDTNLKKLFKDTQDFQNVFEVEIPEEMKKRFKSGIDFIDEVYGEGFVPGTVTLFTGDPGAGKSTLCLQIANALSSQGFIVAYNSSEQHVSQVKGMVDRLGLDHPFYVSNSSSVENVIRQCKQNEVKILIIDSLAAIGGAKFQAGSAKAMGFVMQKVIEYAQQTFTVVILIGHVTKTGVFAGKSSLKHMSDAHLHMDLCTNASCLTCEPGTRTLNMEKWRWGQSNIPQQLFLMPQGFKKI